MIAAELTGLYSNSMKSWRSKVFIFLILSASSAGLSSCKLSGGGQYSSQIEIETDVPESLEYGRASTGPATENYDPYASATSSVPADSDLTGLPDLLEDAATLPAVADSGVVIGGASMTGMTAEGYVRIDIPKPDFGSMRLKATTRRAPAEAMIELEPASAP